MFIFSCPLKASLPLQKTWYTLIHFSVTSTPDKEFEGFLNLLTLSGFNKGNLSTPG